VRTRMMEARVLSETTGPPTLAAGAGAGGGGAVAEDEAADGVGGTDEAGEDGGGSAGSEGWRVADGSAMAAKRANCLTSASTIVLCRIWIVEMDTLRNVLPQTECKRVR